MNEPTHLAKLAALLKAGSQRAIKEYNDVVDERTYNNEGATAYEHGIDINPYFSPELRFGWWQAGWQSQHPTTAADYPVHQVAGTQPAPVAAEIRYCWQNEGGHVGSGEWKPYSDQTYQAHLGRIHDDSFDNVAGHIAVEQSHPLFSAPLWALARKGRTDKL